MRIILFGPPGSGKGTQGDLIERKYGFPKISTGDLLRRAVQDRTQLGMKAEALMNQGKLVSDAIVEELVQERISAADCRRGYLLDGFPRNIAQARSLEVMDGGRPEVVVEIDLDINALLARLQERRICSQCGAIYNLQLHRPQHEGKCDVCGGALIERTDDKPEVVGERIRVYKEQTEKIKSYYLDKSVYRRVDGSGRVEDVFGRLSRLLDRELAKSEAEKAFK